MPIEYPTLVDAPEPNALPLWLVGEAHYSTWLQQLEPAHAEWLRANGFQAERLRVQSLPGPAGQVAGAVMGLGAMGSAQELGVWEAAALPERLPPGTYALATSLSAHAATQFVLGWLMGSYRLSRYRTAPRKAAGGSRLVVPGEADLGYAKAAATALAWARDLINAPANELGPHELAAAASALSEEFGGITQIHQGETLRTQYPLIDAVGAGSARAPRLIDCRWLRPGAPRVTLVGKGVCFDSGGLDLKPSAAMLLMKKDMGGAACALALARLLLQMRTPIELRLLIPAVENSVGGRSYRPGDVWRSRKGLTVEIGNTDAEGRLVLADALCDADAEKPDLLVDFATLTGAARTALGPELPAAFSTEESLLQELRALGQAQGDPLWPMPLWAAYDEELSSRIADMNNVSSAPFAGAIIAALFLRRFVTATPNWLHLDVYAWNPKERPGRPVGAEPQCVRAVYALIRQRFAPT